MKVRVTIDLDIPVKEMSLEDLTDTVHQSIVQSAIIRHNEEAVRWMTHELKDTVAAQCLVEVHDNWANILEKSMTSVEVREE